MVWNVWSLTEERWMLLNSCRSKTAAQRAIDDFLKSDYPGHKLEPRVVRPALEAHGTGGLPFGTDAIWRMAMKDWEFRSGNASASIRNMRHYHFHRDHVRKAGSANDILRAAIAEPTKGRESGKKLTRRLYVDVELLKAALR
jgi:hypothetical protein